MFATATGKKYIVYGNKPCAVHTFNQFTEKKFGDFKVTNTKNINGFECLEFEYILDQGDNYFFSLYDQNDHENFKNQQRREEWNMEEREREHEREHELALCKSCEIGVGRCYCSNSRKNYDKEKSKLRLKRR